MIKSLLKEYGISWIINRSLYSVKLKLLNKIPYTEKLFEKDISVKRIDIFTIDTMIISNFLKNLPDDAKTEIIKTADKAIEGKIIGFSSIELDYGKPINWHYNPLTNQTVDKDLKWFKIPDFDVITGDIKLIWEASRFTHVFYLVRAYLLTRDIKYFNSYVEQVNSWIESNEYSFGANYKCGQEATLRMLNILISYSAFKDSGFNMSNVEEAIIKIVEGSYKKVLSNFFYAHKCIKNNHTLSEITGLIVGAWCCEYVDKLKKAYKLLDNEIENQFLPDGGYIQYSFNYQRFALQLMEINLKISKKTNIEISNKSKALIKKSALLMYQMQDENGELPNYGSNDGSLIFPVTSCGYRDYRAILNSINVMLDGYRLYSNGIFDEELLWFVEEDINNYPVRVIERHSSKYEKSGLFTIRHDQGFVMFVLQNFRTRPAHMDQLHIDLWHRGINILCDNGSYSYASDVGKQLSLTSSHNTVKVDDIEQMNKRVPFLVYDWTSSRNVNHNSTHFVGTMISKNGYKHTRKLSKEDNGYIIDDYVIGVQSECTFYYHTPCQVRVVNNSIELYMDQSLIAIMKVMNEEAKIKIKKGYRSLYYLRKEEINKICITNQIKSKESRLMIEINLL